MFVMSLNILSNLHWSISPAGTAPNRDHLYQYLPNWQVNVVRYDDFSSNYRLWYPELASIIDKYLTSLSLSSISFNVGPLCMGLINAWFNHAGLKHNLTLPFALGTNTKLLHSSAILSTSSGVIMSSCCNLSSLSLNGFCSAYAIHLGGAWYGLLLGLSCNENVPSKHPMPLNTLSTSMCICCVSLVLLLLSVSTFGHDRKYFVSAFALVLTVDPLSLLVVLKMPPMFVQHFLCKGADIVVWLYLCSKVVGWQLRFSLCSGAVTTKALVMVVALYFPLVPDSVEYPMPYASCLGWCGVWLCSACLVAPIILLCFSSACPPVFSLKELCLSKVLGFCSLFYLVHSHDALWGSLSRRMPSGISCLASQVPDWAVAFWDGLSGLWLFDLWLVPTQVCLL